MGNDLTGRVSAEKNDRRLTAATLLVLVGLLVLPFLALARSSLDLRWASGYGVIASAAAYLAYAVDKRRARSGEWRLSETVLHGLELAGGWPGAFVAQRRLRHKCAKVSYQVTFWSIVLLHQAAAFDSLQGWRFSSALWTAFSA